MSNLKQIHIGKLIEKRIEENKIDMLRICNFFESDEIIINEMLSQENIATHLLLKWSKLLEYDFFRLYSQHLILYAPPSAKGENSKKIKSALPQFRKNLYTKEIIDFILEQINLGEMTTNQVIDRYNIPKTTLYKWISKYRNSNNT
ncbi:transposase [Chryseobacterium sp.]|uniref:transposase n=1 Tax=Chryseobacterium sp. TaxID=1871047 RepID=UPI00289A5543|nr:transposase [Chryseobacterium sp.]